MEWWITWIIVNVRDVCNYKLGDYISGCILRGLWGAYWGIEIICEVLRDWKKPSELIEWIEWLRIEWIGKLWIEE